MSRQYPENRCRTARRRRGLTALELLIAISIMLMLVGTLAAVADAVQSSADYSSGRATAVEHARVILERITGMVEGAKANESFPGFLVVTTKIGSYDYPDTLVVWRPDQVSAAKLATRPALSSASRLPYYDELVVYCPDPQSANRLLEIRSTATTVLSSDASQWSTEIATFRDSRVLDTEVLSSTGIGSGGFPAYTLTELLRSAVPAGACSTTRGAIRFESRLRPSETQWKDSSGTAWSNLPWVQGVYGPKTGLRQAWVRIELQLVAPATGGAATGSSQIVPFFGSAAIYYLLHREARP